MSQKSWHLDRRTLLRGSGVALALPWLDCMAASATTEKAAPPKRFCAIYFPYGVSLPGKNSDHAAWRWFPDEVGKDFRFNRSLEILEPHRDQLTVLSGLSHPNGRKMGGHDTADTFLTAAMMDSRRMQNTVSVDQVLADHFGGETRFRSLVLSSDGGVGEPTRSSTLSFDRHGRPVPALNSPRRVFERLFGEGDDRTRRGQRRLRNTSSMLDLVLEDSRALSRRLGAADRHKFEEYIDAVRHTETEVGRAQKWLDIPKPTLSDQDREMLALDADDQAPDRFIRVMFDLLYLAFRTDSTRIATYQIASMNGAASLATKFPQLLEFKNNLHKLAHNWNKPGGAEELGRWDRYLASHLARFLDRMRSVPEGDGTLLDNTLVLYGTSNSNTHNNRNYPLLLAGGRSMKFEHGRHLQFDESTPLSNLFVTLLNQHGVPSDAFADSTGDMTDVLKTV